jgi:fatty acid desaturase
MLQLILYVVVCALTAIGGIDRRGGFFLTFFLALILSPLIVLPVLLLTHPFQGARWRQRP